MDDSKTINSVFPHDDAGLTGTEAAWFAADEDGSDWDVEIVDELTWSDALDEGDELAAAGDPFLRLVSAMERVACAFGGGSETVTLLRGLLGVSRFEATCLDLAARSSLLSADILTQSSVGVVRSERFTRQVLAWQDILREASEDYSACGAATLDEWGADLVARVLGGSLRSDAVRRELRKGGVAAFGLVAAA